MTVSQIDYSGLAKQFWESGYLYLPDIFSEQLVSECQQKILRHFEQHTQYVHSAEFIEKSATDVIPWFPQQTNETCFEAVNNDIFVKTLTQQILGDGWYEQYSMVMFSKKDTLGQAWHQDCLCDNPKHFNLNRLFYTMDIDEIQTGGQVTLIPGSHLTGMIPSTSEMFDDTKRISLSPKKGSLLLLHGHCYHKVEAVTGQYRVSTNYRAAPIGTPENINDVGVYRNMIYDFSQSIMLTERS